MSLLLVSPTVAAGSNMVFLCHLVFVEKAKNGHIYVFWAISRYTTHCTPETVSYHRRLSGLRSIVPLNG